MLFYAGHAYPFGGRVNYRKRRGLCWGGLEGGAEAIACAIWTMFVFFAGCLVSFSFSGAVIDDLVCRRKLPGRAGRKGVSVVRMLISASELVMNSVLSGEPGRGRSLLGDLLSSCFWSWSSFL